MNNEVRPGKNKAKPTFIVLGMSVASIVIVFAAVTALGIMRERNQTPKLAVDSLVKALRKHYKQAGRFPTNLQELNARVWKHKTPQNYGADNRSMVIHNYYYLYYPADSRTCTIWAIPTGPKRDQESTHFLVLTYDTLRRWKGAALSLNEIKDIPMVPRYQEIGAFGMTEQNAINLTKKK